MRGGDHRPVLRVRIGGDAHLQLADGRDQPLAQLVRRPLAHRHHHRQGHAALAGRAEGGSGEVLHRLLHVGVRQDDAVVLGPAHGLDPLRIGGPGGVDVLGDVGGADEAHRLDQRMVQDGVHRRLVAMDHIEDPGRRPGLHHQLGEADRDRRVLFGRLQDKGVAAGYGHAEHPHRDHGRKVERGDPGHDPQRLAHGIDVDPGAGALGIFALQGVGDAAGELDDFQPALDVATAVGDHLAVLAGQQLGQFVHARLDQALELEHQPRAALGIDPGPAGLGAGGRLHGAVHFGLGGQGDTGLNLAGVGIEDVAVPARGAAGGGPVDEVAERAQRGLLGSSFSAVGLHRAARGAQRRPRGPARRRRFPQGPFAAATKPLPQNRDSRYDRDSSRGLL